MQTRLHLVSTPWADPTMPSIQTAALKAYVDSAFGNRVKTVTYSAFMSIVLEQKGTGYLDHFDKYEDFAEYPYFLLCFRRYLRNRRHLRRLSLGRLITRLNQGEMDERLTLRGLNRLECRTKRYIEHTIAPRLLQRGVNLVGFTLNYYQLYSSIYFTLYLKEAYPDYRYVFLFGGATAIYPKVAGVLKSFGLEGVCVVGEGERKLELIVRASLETCSEQYAHLVKRFAALHAGIYEIQGHSLNLYEAGTRRILDLQTPIERLPLPDFGEYYVSLRKTLRNNTLHRQCKNKSWMALEGSRGCFAHCDFCDVHTSWLGFRKGTGEWVADRVLELSNKYRSHRVRFMDNVCDTWAEKYSETLLNRNIRISSFMNSRVHHPEVFWTKLSLSGVEEIQLGIEALSPSLLKAMNKGTRAKQNLLVLKWLKELGIESLSNIITQHPKSTLRHVRETKQLLRLIPHLDRLDFSDLALLIGSPLDAQLNHDERRRLLERQDVELPKKLDHYFVLKGEYEAPAHWYRKGVIEAWEDLREWEEKFFNEFGEKAFMTATRCGATAIEIRDGRYGEVREHYLQGEVSVIYDNCHQGSSLAALASRTGLPSASVEQVLSRLISQKFLVELDGCYIALALRPRDELIHNYYESVVAEVIAPRRVSRSLQAM